MWSISIWAASNTIFRNALIGLAIAHTVFDIADNLRMTKLVDNLLTLSRTNTNEPSLDTTSFILDKAIWMLSFNLSLLWQGKRLS